MFIKEPYRAYSILPLKDLTSSVFSAVFLGIQKFLVNLFLQKLCLLDEQLLSVGVVLLAGLLPHLLSAAEHLKHRHVWTLAEMQNGTVIERVQVLVLSWSSSWLSFTGGPGYVLETTFKSKYSSAGGPSCPGYYSLQYLLKISLLFFFPPLFKESCWWQGVFVLLQQHCY